MKRKEKEINKINEIKKKINSKVVKPFFVLISIIIFTILILILMNKYNLINKQYYDASDFNIKTIYSKLDKDRDNIDDYTDILLGAKKQLNKNINDLELISKSLNNAGYETDESVIEFIKNNSIELTKDCYEINEFQPGDIIIFNDYNLGIISDKRNIEGITYLIHINEKVVEDDYLGTITINSHYRLNS